MMKSIRPLALLALGCAMIVSASAQEAAEPLSVYATKKAYCSEQADAKNFGVHHYQRHRFVVRCLAGLATR
jgi:hypothetical protein